MSSIRVREPFSWITDGNLRTRMASTAGAFTTAARQMSMHGRSKLVLRPLVTRTGDAGLAPPVQPW